MNIDKILIEIGLHNYSSYTQILGGIDSSVFKINTSNGESFALRILPKHRFQQYVREKKIIDIVIQHGVPVPKIHIVTMCAEYSIMLMEWANGRTIYNELQERPESAKKIGFEFGKLQATINKISVPELVNNSNSPWLSQQSNEKNICDKLTPIIKHEDTLLHLDYHPLNVLTDGERITAVIDWANATIGDNRFDFARTFSILRLEGIKHFNQNVITDFEQGWQEGYEQIITQIERLPLFYAWAGLQMKRDLADRLTKVDKIRIEEWVEKWLNIYKDDRVQ